MSFGNKPVAGALLACVPLGAMSVSVSSAKGGESSNVKGRLRKIGKTLGSAKVKKGNNMDGSWKKTNLLGVKGNVNLKSDSGNPSNKKGGSGLRKLEWRKTNLLGGTGNEKDQLTKLITKGEKSNMDGNISDALAELAGGLGEANSKNMAALEGLTKKLMEDISKNNVITNISDFKVDNDVVALSPTDFNSEKRDLAETFLEAKKSGLYDIDWSIDPIKGTQGDEKNGVVDVNKLEVVFGGMGGVMSFGLANFLTVKDVTSGKVVGQINLTPDPMEKGAIKLGVWANDKDKLREALRLAFRALSKNSSVNKVSLSITGSSGKGIEGILKGLAGNITGRFDNLKIFGSENHMDLVRNTANGKYMFLNYTLKTVDGKVENKLKRTGVNIQDVPEGGLDGVKATIDNTRKLFSGLKELASSGGTEISSADSGLKEVLGCDFEVVDSFVVRTTEYEFTEK